MDSTGKPNESGPPQFSLRAALLGMTAVAVFFSVVTWLKLPAAAAGALAILWLTVAIVFSLPQTGFAFGVIFLYFGAYAWSVATFGWYDVLPTVWAIAGLPGSVIFCWLVDSARRRIFNPFNRQ